MRRPMRGRSLLLIAVLALLPGCIGQTSDSPTLRGKVIGIKDGDTIELLVDQERVIVRLAEIDCPERSQPYGNVAKQFTSDLCFGEHVFVTVKPKRDRYGRRIGTLHLSDGRNVNQELIRSGHAWHYTKYSQDTTYARLQREAKLDSIGLWSLPDQIPPWEWRSSKAR